MVYGVLISHNYSLKILRLLYKGKLNMNGKTREFKLGDIVRHTSNAYGEKYVVVQVGKRNVDIYYNGTHYNYPPHCLILVEDETPTTPYPNPPHKHAELIKAWADGADIQCKSVGSWYNILAPHWGNGVEYRIKPTKSAKDTKLEELEASIRKLADEIKELQDD